MEESIRKEGSKGGS